MFRVHVVVVPLETGPFVSRFGVGEGGRTRRVRASGLRDSRVGAEFLHLVGRERGLTGTVDGDAAGDDGADPLLDGHVHVDDPVLGDVDDVATHHRVGGHGEKERLHVGMPGRRLDAVGRVRGEEGNGVGPLVGELDEFDLLEGVGVRIEEELAHLVEAGVDGADAGDAGHQLVEGVLEGAVLGASLGDDADEEDDDEQRDPGRDLDAVAREIREAEPLVDDADHGVQRVGDEVDDEPDDDGRHQEGDGDGRAGDEGVPEAVEDPATERGTVLGQEGHTSTCQRTSEIVVAPLVSAHEPEGPAGRSAAPVGCAAVRGRWS